MPIGYPSPNALMIPGDARIDSVEKRMYDRFDAVDARFVGVDAKIESLEKQIPMIQDIADLKARLAVVEKRTSG